MAFNIALLLQRDDLPPERPAPLLRALAPDSANNFTSMTCFVNTCGCVQPRRPLTIAAFTKAWSAHSYGGLGKHADNLYRALAEKGHTVHVFTTATRPERTLDVEVGAFLYYNFFRYGGPALIFETLK